MFLCAVRVRQKEIAKTFDVTLLITMCKCITSVEMMLFVGGGVNIVPNVLPLKIINDGKHYDEYFEF